MDIIKEYDGLTEEMELRHIGGTDAELRKRLKDQALMRKHLVSGAADA